MMKFENYSDIQLHSNFTNAFHKQWRRQDGEIAKFRYKRMIWAEAIGILKFLKDESLLAIEVKSIGFWRIYYIGTNIEKVKKAYDKWQMRDYKMKVKTYIEFATSSLGHITDLDVYKETFKSYLDLDKYNLIEEV